MPRPPSVEAIERKLNYPEFILTRYFIAFLNGDGGMGRKATLARRAQHGRHDFTSRGAGLARSGRLEEARRTSEVAVNIAKQSGQRERAAMFGAATAVWGVLRQWSRSETEDHHGPRARQGP